MVETSADVPSVCPDPSKHRRLPLWRRCVDILAVTAFLGIAGLLSWSLFGIKMHMIALSQGDFGSYGVIELPDILKTNTRILEFSAIRVPSRVVRFGQWVRWPVPEVLEVTVRYQEPDGTARSWEKTYLLACEGKGACEPLSVLRGVILYGQGADGKLAPVERNGWVYFRDARPPQENAVPGAPAPHVLRRSQPPAGPGVPLPKPTPQPLPPGVLIA